MKPGSMNRSVNNRGWHYRSLSIGILWICLLAPGIGFCSDKPAGETRVSSKIHITAQRLVFSQKDRYAEFTGSVRTTQGTTLIRSDTLKVHYKEGADLPSGGGNNEDLIERIIASGNVTIAFEDQTAFSDQAVYTPANGMLVLTGSRVRVESKGNFINGEQIVMDRNSGEITVIGGSEHRVEAVFESDADRSNDASGDQ